jgi:hypothetical protein
MSDVRRAAVTNIDDGRDRRVSRAVAARRRLDRAPFPTRAGGGERQRAGGRAWLNGVEVGGTDPRHATLTPSYD